MTNANAETRIVPGCEVPRPSKVDCIPGVAKRLVDMMVNDGSYPDVEGMAKAIENAAYVTLNFDAYKMAKHIERHCHLDIDYYYVRELSRFRGLLDIAHDRAITKWVAENDIKPQFSPGDTVQFLSQGEWKDGVIVDISYPWMKPAMHAIRQIDETGHIAEFYVEFENVRKCETK